MTDRNQNFEIWAGNAAQLRIAITDSSTGTGMTLSSASSVVWKLLPDSDSTASPVLTKSTGGSGITVSTCVATVTLSPANTSSLSGRYAHQCKVADASGSAVTVTVGTVTINKSI